MSGRFFVTVSASGLSLLHGSLVLITYICMHVWY